jgi:hypothetical protein
MIKKLLLLSALSLCAATAMAQDPMYDLPSQQLKQRLRNQYLHNDTAQAIITLYGRRQLGGASWVLSGMLSALRMSIGSNTTSNYGGYRVQETTSGNVGAAFLIATPIMAYGVGKELHYSNGNLEKVLTAYGAGQPLPHSLRRKLKHRFFTQPIIEYKTAKVTPAP